MSSEVTLTIDDVKLTVPAGTLLVEAAKRVRAEIPVYCYHSKLGPAGLCRICLVEVEKTPKLQIACNTVVAEGMVVRTQGPKVEEGRRAVQELLLLDHPLDCPICDKGGECDLQDFSVAYGQGASRKIDAKSSKPKAVDLGPTIVLDEERCIVCQRCVRFDDIITAERTLVLKDRGHNNIIATATGEPYRSDFSGNVTELCPVGALTSKTYRFKSRPWDLRRTESTCTQCSVGCGLNVDVRHGQVLRTMSVQEDDAHSDGWLCDRGRYNIGFLDDARRLTSPMLRSGREWTQVSWDDAIGIWARQIKEAIASGGARSVGIIGGGRLLNEEIVLLQHLFRSLEVRNLDWRAGRQRTATPLVGASYADIETAQTIVVLGASPAGIAPVLDLRIRKAVHRNAARLVVAARVAEIAREALEVERVAIVWDGVDLGSYAELTAALSARVEAGRTRAFTFIPGEQGNARGAERYGMLPKDAGLEASAMFENARVGGMRAFALFGVNPMLRFGDGMLVGDALDKVPFVVVSELFMTETAQRASLVLPARSAFEKDGTIVNASGDLLPVRAALASPQGTLSDGEMIVALAAELGVALPGPEAVEEMVRAGRDEPRRLPEASESTRASGARDSAALRVALAPSIFAGGGTIAHDTRLSELRPKATVTLSEGTAQTLRVHDGDIIDLAAEENTERAVRDLVVRVRKDVDDGVAFIVDGLPEAPANRLAIGEAVCPINPRSSREPLVEATV